MSNIVLCIGYDGTLFHGYQKQLKERSVQTTLEVCISTLFKQQIDTIVAGRTDAGVHAEKQFVNFCVEYSHIPFDRIGAVLNTMLPHDIRVYWSREISRDFHARYSALKREYYYQLFEGKNPPPFLRPYCWNVPKELNWNEIQEDCNALIGTHNFFAFSSYNKQIQNHIRTIDMIEITQDRILKRIVFRANGFLWKMVRTIMGTVIERAVHRKKGIPIAMNMQDIVASKDRGYAGSTAPPHGLFLYNVEYKKEYGITESK